MLRGTETLKRPESVYELLKYVILKVYIQGDS